MAKIAECDCKLVQYRAALDAGVIPVTVAGWIADVEAEKAGYQMAAAWPVPSGGG